MRIDTIWVQYPDGEIELRSAIDNFASAANPDYMVEELASAQKALTDGEIVAFRELYLSVKKSELVKLFKPRVIPVVQVALKEKDQLDKREKVKK